MPEQQLNDPVASAFYARTDPICVAGLRDSLNAASNVYDRQLMDKRWRQTYEFYPTEDLTSTAICLIGISRAGIAPNTLALDPARTLGAMYDLAKQRAYPGGFGLVVWANAVWNGVDIAQLQQRCGVDLGDLAQWLSSLTTMEVAWLVSGLAHEWLCREHVQTRAWLDTALEELLERRYQPKTAIMAHAGEAATFVHGLRRWIANFADQIYSIQAFAFVHLMLGHPRALAAAEAVAAKMVAYQGGKGQWWWHYDAKRGGVPQPYSVYSVHQHGMAPMALRALSAAGGSRHEAAIVASRNWMDENELGVSLIDATQPTLWRSVEYDDNRVESAVRKVSSLLGLAGDQSTQPAAALRLNCETRPYEWAWCVYAGAIEREYERGLHLV
ncbi:MAG: hypothetical protein ACFCUG_12955 [Thiotrichales bacterium]